MILICMWLLKTKKRVSEFNSSQEIEDYFKKFDCNLAKFTDRMNSCAITLLNSTTEIGTREFIRWYKRSISGGVSQLSMKYWINRGHSQEHTKHRISLAQSNNVKKKREKLMIKQLAGDSSWRESFNTTVEYYVKQGFTEDEAKVALKKRQTTFSLQTCIQRYGEQEGTKVWRSRQEKWINTLASKTSDEKLEILRKKVVKLGRASRESLAIFAPLHKMLVEKGVIEDSDIYYGYNDRNEYYLADNDNYFLYDFTIRSLKLIIEFNGTVWHVDPRISPEQLKSWRNPHGIGAVDVMLSDNKKREFAASRGFTVIDLWGADTLEHNMKKTYDAIIQRLETCGIDVPISRIESLMNSSEVSINTPDGYCRVTDFFVRNDKKLFDILCVNGTRLKCSDDHRVRLSTGQWALVSDIYNAKDVMFNVELMTNFGSTKILTIVDSGIGTVNDITVDHPEHSYYANGIVSHNCGKTLLAIAAALEQLKGLGNKPRYDKLIVSRPVQPMGRDIGFLPGTLEEKMEPWIAPIRDNINYLVGIQKSQSGRRSASGESKKGFNEYYLQLMQEKGLIEIEALTYIRGRSIPNSFIILDEAQNLSMHELKTIITRVGDNTKIVLTGDIDQIDNTHVDVYTNGLTYAIEKFKSHPIAGHITLQKGERSPLATIASQILLEYSGGRTLLMYN